MCRTASQSWPPGASELVGCERFKGTGEYDAVQRPSLCTQNAPFLVDVLPGSSNLPRRGRRDIVEATSGFEPSGILCSFGCTDQRLDGKHCRGWRFKDLIVSAQEASHLCEPRVSDEAEQTRSACCNRTYRRSVSAGAELRVEEL